MPLGRAEGSKVNISKCLTIIDHDSMQDNKVFVTCNASDWRTSAMLIFRQTRSVAFNFMQLKGAEKNYPIHEKELLVMV
jgi:hypothetical protein